MITQDEPARTAERLRDALTAAADIMAECDAAAIITPVPQRARQTQAREGMADPADRRSLRSRDHRCLGIAHQ
jgi:hypothetical protein